MADLLIALSNYSAGGRKIISFSHLLCNPTAAFGSVQVRHGEKEAHENGPSHGLRMTQMMLVRI